MQATVRCVIAIPLLVLAGCAGLDAYRAEPISGHLSRDTTAETARCARLFAALDREVERWGVRDARGSRLPGLPYLRSDRVLAQLAAKASGDDALHAWIGLAASMDEVSRRNEIAHLPDEAFASQPGASRAVVENASRQCRSHLLVKDLAEPDARAALPAAARVPAEYQQWKRTLGLYPLTRVSFARGVREWQSTTEAVFKMPLAALPEKGNPVGYAPPLGRQPSGDLSALFADGARNTLGLLEWNDAQRETLFAQYAPRILVDEAGEDDRIGMLEYDAEGRLRVNTLRPVVYRRLSHTLLGGRWLPQFVYSFWFPARTAESGTDLLAGRFDGLIWRVTVGPDGHPLVYDTIHPCGCYHLFFPTAAVRARPQADSIDETLFAPQSLPMMRAGESLLLHLQAGTHYLRRVVREGGAPESHRYDFAEDDDLRSLPLPVLASGGAARRSAFGPDGIIAGSERGERFLFWPMGIDNAGAMRQWGRHATAFVGERHFDDPDLFEKYFEILREPR